MAEDRIMVGMLDGIIHHTVIYVPMVIAHYIIYAHMHGVVMHGETCPMPRLTVTVVKVLRYGVVHEDSGWSLMSPQKMTGVSRFSRT